MGAIEIATPVANDRKGDQAADRERVIEAYLPLVRRIAARFAGRGERLEDLVQVGSIGLIKAVDRCDPQRRERLTAYVARTVEGEIRRHLRDRTSTMRIPRRLQQLETGDLRPLPADEEELPSAPGDEPDDVGVARALVASAARSLDRRERRVVLLHYFLDLSQEDVGKEVGVSQVHVSRLLKGALAKMRAGLAT